MATLENTITGLMARPKESPIEEVPGTLTSDGNTTSTQLGSRLQHGEAQATSSHRSPADKRWAIFKEPTYTTPPFSTMEAQNMIEQELRQGKKLSKQKREAFHAALRSLSDSLTTSYHDQNTLDFDRYDLHLDAQKKDLAKYPEIETIKWMLTRK